MKLIFSSLALCLLLVPDYLAAELLPEQVAIIANIKSPDSIRVARHYASVRGIPQTHILRVELPLTETVSRKLYEEKLVSPVRDQLIQKGLASSVRALATTYGIPLRVKPPEQHDDDKHITLSAITVQNQARLALTQIAFQAEGIAGGKPSVEKSEPHETSPEETKKADQLLISRTREALSAAAKRVNQLENQAKRKTELQKLSPLVIRYGGLTALMRNLKQEEKKESDQLRETRAKLMREIQSAQKLLLALDQTVTPANRRRAYMVTERVYGVVGVLNRANAEIQSKKYEAADASLDSELSFLWWDRDMYRLSGRLPNPLYHGFSSGKARPPLLLPVIMVSRLDAPTVDLAIALIDQARTAEQKGLKGNVYVDARGFKSNRRDNFGLWDQNLRDLAWMFRRTTSFNVRLNNTGALFDKAPDTAVYVGWYRLRNYNDVFTFSPGAIGFHIASEEAVSIRDPEEKGWCKNMLERGVTVTVGAIAEPYLDAFPLPQEFFGLLLSGTYSLVEVYYLTIPYLSWRMVIIGDPLYNPWRGQNLVSYDDLALRSKRDQRLKSFPTPPAELPFNNPVTVREKLKNDRATLHGQIDSFFNQLEQQAKPHPEAQK